MAIYPNGDHDWKEDHLQTAVAHFLNGLEAVGVLAWNHPPNEGKRTGWHGNKLKSHGMKAGQPDCEIFLKNGQTIFIELKTVTGDVSDKQQRRAAILSKLGYPVYFVIGETPQDAVNQVEKILREHGGL